MKKIIFDDPYMRKSAEDKDNEELYDISNHHFYLNNIYNEIDHSYNNIIMRQIKKKYNSYKSQDKLKKKYDEEFHITIKELIQKLFESNLKCYYCCCDLIIIYNKKNEKNQWSLERLDNNIGHYTTNTCISCLQCNLNRNTSNHEYYKFSKQMVIKKYK